MAVRLTDAEVRAHRVATHLGGTGVLDTGVQDTPPGGAAHLALAARGHATRGELVRRFLRYAGPTDRDGLAAWLALSPAAARRWWELADVVPVEVDGRRLFLHPDDLDAARAAPAARGVSLLPPYDPVLELGDRALLVPDPARRKQVWRATANPGVVLAAGAVAGTWRRRKGTITVTPFGRAPDRRALAAAAGEEVVVAES
ncbi:Winged helix DNA-binding domain-containing protein [Asanoa hainanensis]|uniref:Winged helix DNA-binding domain-containing protein n=1 Tax=Asanoa hainanensis TaxID=560556 RepID=A0A239MC67_9ACTN|nr:crosslink repair DNA glycosylase YcaQ family protein [Asanoa hainanensis]SNT39628.1 Winged helix DNA-binding domain-containing protein [Asanoa hainanensis]